MKGVLAALSALWATAMGRRPRPVRARAFIARVTWDFGSSWKGWPW